MPPPTMDEPIGRVRHGPMYSIGSIVKMKGKRREKQGGEKRGEANFPAILLFENDFLRRN